MNIIKSWLSAWLTKHRDNQYKDNCTTQSTPKKPKPNANFYSNYFSLIADGARLKLIEPMFKLNLFALFENKTSVLESDIIYCLGLKPIRAKKWLHLLSCEHFLIKVIIDDFQTAYQLPEDFIQLMKSDKWWGIQFFFNTWMVAADENLTDVLRFGHVKTSVSWPPKTDAEVAWLEDWMRNTAEQPLNCLLEHIHFKKINSVLDVGGGDGTMACALVKAHPHLKAAVYNLSKPAAMARHNIESQGLSHQVRVIEGDFIAEDEFPVGFDLIIFTRVLFDWNESTDRKLLKMAFQALPKNGLVAICEFFKEESHDQCLAAEYRYIFHDDFKPNVMKTAATYRTILEDMGFTIVIPTTEKKASFTYYSLILAQKTV